MKADTLLRCMRILRITREVLAWTAVILAVPMAAFSIAQSWTSKAWEKADMRWEREDRERHQIIGEKIDTLLERCK